MIYLYISRCLLSVCAHDLLVYLTVSTFGVWQSHDAMYCDRGSLDCLICVSPYNNGEMYGGMYVDILNILRMKYIDTIFLYVSAHIIPLTTDIYNINEL